MVLGIIWRWGGKSKMKPDVYRVPGVLGCKYEGFSEGGFYETCYRGSFARLSIEGKNTFCYEHAKKVLEEIKEESEERGEYWENAGKKTPSCGGSLALIASYHDVGSSEEFLRELERLKYLDQEFRKSIEKEIKE
jgi:hypothetical protein